MLNCMPVLKNSIPCSFMFILVMINDLLSKASHWEDISRFSIQEFVVSYDS